MNLNSYGLQPTSYRSYPIRKKFDAILFDVDSKDKSIGMSCPPKQFLEPTTLNNVSKLLNQEGMFILNLVIREESLRPSILKDLKTNFITVASYKLKDELNEIVICFNKHVDEKFLMSKTKEARNKIVEFYKKNKLEEDLSEADDLLENLHIQ